MTKTSTQELDTASLDQVVGGADTTTDALGRKQEQEDKLVAVRKAGGGMQE